MSVIFKREVKTAADEIDHSVQAISVLDGIFGGNLVPVNEAVRVTIYPSLDNSGERNFAARVVSVAQSKAPLLVAAGGRRSDGAVEIDKRTLDLVEEISCMTPAELEEEMISLKSRISEAQIKLSESTKTAGKEPLDVKDDPPEVRTAKRARDSALAEYNNLQRRKALADLIFAEQGGGSPPKVEA